RPASVSPIFGAHRARHLQRGLRPPPRPQLRTLVRKRVRERQPRRPLQLPLQACRVGKVETENRDHRAEGAIHLRDRQQSLSGKSPSQRAGVAPLAGRKKSPRPRNAGEALSRTKTNFRNRRRERKLLPASVNVNVSPDTLPAVPRATRPVALPALGDLRFSAEPIHPMIQRIATAVVLIPLVLLLVLKAPAYLLVLVSAAVALLAIAEFLKLTTHYTVQPLSSLAYAFVALFFVFEIIATSNRTPLVETTAAIYGIALAAALAPFIFLTAAMRRPEMSTGYPAAAASVFAFAYIAIPMALLVEIRRQPAGAIWVIYTLLAVWAGDIFAYFVGKSLGRHRSSRRNLRPRAASTLAHHLALRRRQHSRAARRPGRVPDQTRRRSQRFRLHPPRPRRHARPNRRHALRRPSSLGLPSLAVDAVDKRTPARRSS